jgi:A/G-specific adenine glycosylase
MQQAIFPLLQWYQENARVLPWRTDPSPYRVWVSEIMLQQTRVAAVIGYFERFMAALPTVQALAQVPEDELLKLWQGLGYYNRARNLQKAARQIVQQYAGEMPADYDSILSLSGIGAYTAGAISSIAFGIPVPAVDGNVLRVLARILGDARDISRPDTKQAVQELLQAVIPHNAPGAFNQALMELGATVCLPNGAPLCQQCPVQSLCLAFQQSRTDELPVKAAKKSRRIEARTIYLIFHRGAVALRKRPSKGLLAKLWEYPNALTDEANPLETWGIHPAKCWEGDGGKHIFTHIEWHLTSQCITVDEDTLPEGWVWAKRWELEQIYAIPNAFSCVAHQVEEELKREEMEG